MFRFKRQSDKSAIMLMMNTVLFGTGAGLVTLAWMQVISRNPESVSIIDAAFNFEEPLLMITVAILLAGVFHSFTILYPSLVKDHEKRQKALSEANDYKDQAHRDPLTSLHNRRYFDAMLGAYFTEFGKQKMPFGLLIFDVDHFKAVNDKYGHNAGDDVLREISKVTKGMTREYDVIARIGGEEFAVIIANVTEQQLANIAERYRSRIENHQVFTEGKRVSVTVSIGTALSIKYDSTQNLMATADERLYAAKEQGRNCVVSSEYQEFLACA